MSASGNLYARDRCRLLSTDVKFGIIRKYHTNNAIYVQSDHLDPDYLHSMLVKTSSISTFGVFSTLWCEVTKHIKSSTVGY